MQRLAYRSSHFESNRHKLEKSLENHVLSLLFRDSTKTSTTSTLHANKTLNNQSVKLHNENKLRIKFYLPVSQENNRFDDDKLWNWVERLKQIFACHIKQCQSIQCHCIRDCVYNGEIQIRLVRTEIPILVFSFCIKYECNSN